MDPEDPDSDPDNSQNLIISSFYHFGHILKISSKCICQFLSYLVHKQTNRGPKMTLRYFGGQWMTFNEEKVKFVHAYRGHIYVLYIPAIG